MLVALGGFATVLEIVAMLTGHDGQLLIATLVFLGSLAGVPVASLIRHK